MEAMLPELIEPETPASPGEELKLPGTDGENLSSINNFTNTLLVNMIADTSHVND
jgi:hypothetical protein